MKEIYVSTDGTEEAIDVDKLDSDPNEQAKLKYALEAEHYRRNIMTLDEFENKYAILFKKEVTAKESKEYQALSQEYIYRIDPYYPVYVVYNLVSDKVSELLDKKNVVYTLPPIFNRVGIVNNLGKDGIDIMQAFNNLATNSIDDRFNKKKETYTKYLSLVFKAMTDNTTFEKNKSEAKKLADAAMSRSEQLKTNPNAEAAGEEVQDIPADMLEDLAVASAATNDKISVTEEEEYL